MREAIELYNTNPEDAVAKLRFEIVQGVHRRMAEWYQETGSSLTGEQLELQAQTALQSELEEQVTAVLERAMESENNDDWDRAMQASRASGEALGMRGTTDRVVQAQQGRALDKYMERLYRSTQDLVDENEGES